MKRRTGLFLCELVIAVLVFALASTVCVRLFVAAREMTDEARDLTYAVNVASNAAEFIRARGYDEAVITEMSVSLGDGLSLDVAREDGAYRVSVVNNCGESVFSITAAEVTSDE